MTREVPSTLEHSQRIVAVDVLRGICLLGILFINAPLMNSPYWMNAKMFAFQKTDFDRFIDIFFHFFIDSSFYPIFCFMFGVSASLFLWSKNKSHPEKFFVKRILSLFIFGFLQVLLVWWGDILMIYASMGIFLIPLRKMNQRQNFIFLSMVVALLIFSRLAYVYYGGADYGTAQDFRLVYQNGTFFEIFQQRFKDGFLGLFATLTNPNHIGNWFSDLSYYTGVLFFFLYGYYVQTYGFLKSLLSDTSKIKKYAFIFFIILFASRALSYAFPFYKEFYSYIATCSQSQFYAMLVFFFVVTSKNRLLFRGFALMGRMSLSNYLLCNTLMSLVLYNYGLGLYGKIGPGTIFFIVPFIYLTAYFFTRFWLKKHAYGPMEYVWRYLTYGQIEKRITKIFAQLEK
jgi:uncharacterized protein